MNKSQKQFFMAAAAAAVGVVILNNVKSLAGSTIIGKVISGGLVRRA